MTRFVFGDIHGQFDGLMKLIDFIKCSPTDKLFFLGDLIDRGERSADVVRWVMDNNHICLKGNHEQMLHVECQKFLLNLLASLACFNDSNL